MPRICRITRHRLRMLSRSHLLTISQVEPDAGSSIASATGLLRPSESSENTASRLSQGGAPSIKDTHRWTDHAGPGTRVLRRGVPHSTQKGGLPGLSEGSQPATAYGGLGRGFSGSGSSR